MMHTRARRPCKLLVAIGLAALDGTLPTSAVAESSSLADALQFTAESVYTGEQWLAADGGSAYLDNVDVTVELDAAQWTVFGYALYNNGHTVAGLVDSSQGVSNIESTNDLRLYELWYEWRSSRLPLSMRLGLYDLNSEFDAVESAALFINPSHGIGVDFSQSGDSGPSIFPSTSLALRAAAAHDQWTFRAAVLDGAPGDGDRLQVSREEGWLLVGEANRTFDNEVRIGAGYWRYSADFDDIAAVGEPKRRDDNAGMYLFAEAALVSDQERGRALDAFVRIGQAEDRINAVRNYLGAGLIYSAPFERQSDRMGVAVAIAEAGTAYRSNFAGSAPRSARESIVELTYRLVVADWLALQPDVQYIIDPAFDARSDAAWMFALRFEIGMTTGVGLR